MKNSLYKRSLTGLLGIHVCWAALDLLIATFLIAELIYETGSIGVVALFNIVVFSAIFIFFFIFAYIAKRYSCVWCVRGGVLVNVILVALICLLPNKLVEFNLLFAALNGMAGGIFWVGMNNYTRRTMGGTKMVTFQSYLQVSHAAARIIFPFTIGFLIHYISFFIAAIVAFGIGVILVAFSLLLYEDKRNTVFSMKRYFVYMKKQKLFKPVFGNFAIQFIRMFWSTCAAFCVTVLIAVVINNSFTLGWLNSVFSAGAIAVAMAYRFIKPGKLKNVLFIGTAVLSFLLSLGLLFSVDKLTIILFQLGSAVCLIIPNIETATLQLDVMKKLGHEKYNTESVVLVEFAYFVARMVGFGLIFLAFYVDGPSMWMFRILTVVFMSMAIICSVCVKLWYRAYTGVKPREVPPTHPPVEIAPQLQESNGS